MTGLLRAAAPLIVALLVSAACAAATTAPTPAGNGTPTPSLSPFETVTIPPLPTATIRPTPRPATPTPVATNPAGPTIVSLGDTVARAGATLRASAITATDYLCHADASRPDITSQDCRQGEVEVALDPPALLVDVAYCLNDAADAVTISDGSLYVIGDLSIGDGLSSTAIGEYADTFYYGGVVSRNTLGGALQPGMCGTGYLPFPGGVGKIYLMWGENPLASDAIWWSLPPL